MKIQSTINKFIFNNRFFKARATRLEAIDEIKDNGCKIIRERAIGCKSRVILGYKNEYSDLASMAAKVSSDGSFEYKYSSAVYSPIPSSKKTYSIRKVKTDRHGNTDVEIKKLVTQDGKIYDNYSKVTHYENP